MSFTHQVLPSNSLLHKGVHNGVKLSSTSDCSKVTQTTNLKWRKARAVDTSMLVRYSVQALPSKHRPCDGPSVFATQLVPIGA